MDIVLLGAHNEEKETYYFWDDFKKNLQETARLLKLEEKPNGYRSRKKEITYFGDIVHPDGREPVGLWVKERLYDDEIERVIERLKTFPLAKN